MKPYLIIAVITLGTAGCATTPVATSEADLVPSERIISTAFLEPKANTGEVIVKRDRGFGGSACSSRVYVDGAAVADLRPSEKIILHLTVGDHIIGSNPNGVCGGGLSEVSVLVKKEKSVTLRIRYGSNGDYAIQPTAL